MMKHKRNIHRLLQGERMDREITQFINFSTWDDYRWYFSGDARDYFVRYIHNCLQ